MLVRRQAARALQLAERAVAAEAHTLAWSAAAAAEQAARAPGAGADAAHHDVVALRRGCWRSCAGRGGRGEEGRGARRGGRGSAPRGEGAPCRGRGEAGRGARQEAGGRRAGAPPRRRERARRQHGEEEPERRDSPRREEATQLALRHWPEWRTFPSNSSGGAWHKQMTFSICATSFFFKKNISINANAHNMCTLLFW